MNKYIDEALAGYESAIADLKKITSENTNFCLTPKLEEYPIRFVFEPTNEALQESLFGPDENDVIGQIVVICSSGGTGVDLGIKCHIQAEILKKLLSKCAGTCEAYLHAQRAQTVALGELE